MVLTGREKATIFLSILGAETAARILRYLPEELADIIAAGVNHLPSPSPEALSEVLEDFQSYMALPEERIRPELEAAPFERKTPLTPKKVYSLLMYERPQVAAFLLNLLSPEERSEALLNLPKERYLLEELMHTLKKNALTPKLESKLKEQFAGKLF